jgi:hypothetical protein
MAQRESIQSRNDEIKNDYRLMVGQYLRPGHIYDILAKKYWLKPASIQRICTDNYNKQRQQKFESHSLNDSRKIVLEIFLHNLKMNVHES